MYLTQRNLQDHPRLVGHLAELVAHRNVFRNGTEAMLAANQAAMSPAMLAFNALAGISQEYWRQIDATIVRMRDQETGMEILNDLLAVQTVLPIGKTVAAYNVTGEIADDVAISIDGQAPYSFDHAEFGNDGDPVPIFTAGFGVNWRHNAGLQTVGIDLILESQETKMIKFNKALVAYTLDGSNRISVDGKPGQGLRNHRNTIKVDLTTAGPGGAAIDLTTATAAELVSFFTSGTFGQVARANKVAAYDVLWVSPEIMANLSQPDIVEFSAGNTMVRGSVLEIVAKFLPGTTIRQTFALSGNEYLAYQRRRDVVSPLVGMAVGVVPLPRLMPQANHNFQIMSAMGIQVKRDGDNKSGVQYGAELT